MCAMTCSSKDVTDRVTEVLTSSNVIKRIQDFNPLDPAATKVRDTISRNNLGLEPGAEKQTRLACITRIAKSIMAAPNMATRTILHRQIPEISGEVYEQVQALIIKKKAADTAAACKAKEEEHGWETPRRRVRRQRQPIEAGESLQKVQNQLVEHVEGEEPPQTDRADGMECTEERADPGAYTKEEAGVSRNQRSTVQQSQEAPCPKQ
ncbi:hypothetical protein SeMB42_g00822 [Synchytrium endobioticum]|uniref:Uncharacterized protein n=1 Tax=Synchytrium endobioticum TaxID=286115 RepID=A0A507DQ58_9FUNG|nr:hypothetical protein SeMB42_g00822 [Synchytrium endobioticum]